jgi:NTP pyrophosphatase (non-canonical NTP hydrolase)
MPVRFRVTAINNTGETMEKLREELRRFAKVRDWDKYHSPKNLAMALSVEVSEIAEHFQWLTEEESRTLPPEKLAQLKEEIGDVLIYLVRLADKCGIDPLQAAREKLEKNQQKYPASIVKGKALKYTEY